MEKLKLFRIVRVLHNRTETRIKVGLPIFALILFLALSLLYKLTTVSHVAFGY